MFISASFFFSSLLEAQEIFGLDFDLSEFNQVARDGLESDEENDEDGEFVEVSNWGQGSLGSSVTLGISTQIKEWMSITIDSIKFAHTINFFIFMYSWYNL